MAGKLIIRKYTEKHRIETLTMDDKWTTKIRSHFINDKLKSRDVSNKFPHDCLRPLYILNKTKFNAFRKNNHYCDIITNKEILTHVIPDEPELDKMVFPYESGHVLFTHDVTPIPYLHTFDYIGTSFHEEALDLNKAIKILKNHKDVKFVSEIKDIPYYNADEGKYKYIEVHICPSDDVYTKFYKECVKLDKKFCHWSSNMKDRLHDGYAPDKKNNYLGLYPDAVKKRK
jgi:hypothetical protein